MGCIKCGRDIPEGQVFCDSCLEVMAKYPVKAETAVQLPRKKEMPAVKKAYTKRRQPPAPEEQIRTLRRWVRRFAILWLVTLLLLIAALYPALKYFFGDSLLLPGQNYSTFSDIENP